MKWALFYQSLKDLFNWKDYPANVFYLVTPLTIIGVALNVAWCLALFHQTGSYTPLVILVVFLAAAGLATWQNLKLLRKLKELTRITESMRR